MNDLQLKMAKSIADEAEQLEEDAAEMLATLSRGTVVRRTKLEREAEAADPLGRACDSLRAAVAILGAATAVPPHQPNAGSDYVFRVADALDQATPAPVASFRRSAIIVPSPRPNSSRGR